MEDSEWMLAEAVRRALAEDLGGGDITGGILIPEGLNARGSMVVKGEGVIAGMCVAERVFHTVDSKLGFVSVVEDGSEVVSGDMVATVEGHAGSILRAERVALNFVQRLSGIASETRRYVEAVRGIPVSILDTRKTAPGLRALEKYAVRVGGGRNHRTHLGDGVLIKDNHLALLRGRGEGIGDVVARCKRRVGVDTMVEVEVKTVAEAVEAAKAEADIIMLDNMGVDEMCEAVGAIGGRARVEASGGVTLQTVRRIAETGVDCISVGALTHAAVALDVSLCVEPIG